MSQNPDQQLIEQALPGYEIGVELGRGAWGVVLSGRHKRLGRRVAIKQLPRSFGADPGVAGRFLREAQMAASLDHPHIVPVYDYVEKDGLGLIVMEQCATTVGAKFAAEGLHTDEACYAALATCSALAYAHGRGVLHRDIKPENLLMDNEGVVKLGDFGIARAVDEATRLTATGTVIGTPAYMSPEQASGQDLGPGSDVYSIGVVLYELLSGTLPFTDVSTFGALIRQHLTEPPRPLLTVANDVPARVAAAVDRALVKDPTERWESAAAFGVALGEATSQAFGAGWPRQRRFALSGSPDVLAATEREIGGDPRPGSMHVAGDAPTAAPVTGAGMAAPTAASTSGENQPHSMNPPLHPTTAPPAAGVAGAAAAAAASAVPAPTAEVPPPPATDRFPAGPPTAQPPDHPRISGDWAPPAAATQSIQPLAAPETAAPQWPVPGPPVADNVAGSSGGGGAGPVGSASSGSGGGSSKMPLILGGVGVVLLGLIGLVAVLVAGGGDDGASPSTTGSVTTAGQSPSTTEGSQGAGATTDPVSGGASGDAFILGTLIDDGEFANDDDQSVAIDLAVDDIEAAGGVLGQPMVVLPGLYPDDTTLAITAAEHVAAGATAIVGPTDPVDTDDVVNVVTSRGAVLMSPTDFFARQDSSGLYFQTRIPNTLVGEAAASLVDPAAEEVVLIRPSESFLANEGVIQAVIDQLDEQLTDVIVVDVIDDDVVQTANEVASLNPDAIMIYAVIDKTSLYAALVDAGIRPAELPWVVIGDDGSAIDSGDGLVTGVQGITADFLTGRDLEERLPATSLSSAAAQAYDAVIILALAAELAGTPDGTALAETLPLVTGGGQECTTFAQCKELIAAGTEIDYVGPGGSYDLSPTNGRPQSGFFRVTVVGDNGFAQNGERLLFDRNG